MVSQFAQRNELTMNIVEDHLTGDSRRAALLRLCNVAASYLQQIVQQQAKRKLKDGTLRSAANEPLQMKHFGNLLENIFNAPATQVGVQEVGCRIPVGVG